jgi:phospholipid/cholesterol/gamma-HCH transport system ATP-binding protein
MIEGVNLHKAFGPKKVLQGFDIEIKKGESMVIIGGSGTGKSVFIKHIIRLLKPDKGTVFVEGTDISTLDETGLYRLRRRFGMLFQGAALFDSLNVWQNVGFLHLQERQLPPEQIKELAIEKLKLVGLIDAEDLMPSELSGGMKKRVGLARAISYDAEVILYDEPTTGLDPIMADAINDLIVEMREKLSVTSVTITHDMQSAYKIADRISMLYEGRIIQTGTPQEIRDTDNPYVKQFVTGSAHGPIQLEGINR